MGVCLQTPFEEEIVQFVFDCVIFVLEDERVEVDQFSEQDVLIPGKSFPLVLVVQVDGLLAGGHRRRVLFFLLVGLVALRVGVFGQRGHLLRKFQPQKFSLPLAFPARLQRVFHPRFQTLRQLFIQILTEKQRLNNLIVLRLLHILQRRLRFLLIIPDLVLLHCSFQGFVVLVAH